MADGGFVEHVNVGELSSPTPLTQTGDPPPPPQTFVEGGAGAEGRGRGGGGWRGVLDEEDGVRKAASEGRGDTVRHLLQAGASLQPDREGRTALHFAAQNGHAEVCKLLVQEGCVLNLQDTMGYTALLRASSQGVVSVVIVLLEAGCAVDFADHHGNTALHEAAWHGFSQTVQLLIKYNADVFRTNQSGFSALHLAAQNGHNESCRVMLYGGVNSDLQNNYGDTALHTAARYGHAGVTRILISARCKMNVPNKNGDTALHIAAALKRRKITKILVESGVDTHVRNKQNERAVDVARRKEHPEVILLITSLSRPRSAGPKTREVSGVTFKDDLEGHKGPVVCAEDEHPGDKPEKVRRLFPFFRKNKKDKEDKPVAAPAPKPAGSGGKVHPLPATRVSGFFSQYVPRSGTQYYRDLAGNIKQGPVGYTPVCQCGPTLQHIEKSMHQTKEMLYQHIDASHQVLQDRIEHLDQRTSQQAHSMDRLTQERLQEERRACQFTLEQRLQRERHHTQYVVESYGEGLQGQIQGWLEDRLASYGHCLDHHHDDTALPSSRIFTDIHLGPDGGRLFRSRSDETLSVSDYSGKGRKRQFYESRKAAMEQIRGWKVPTGNNRESSSSRRKERGRSVDELDRRGRRGREEATMPDRTRGKGRMVVVGEVRGTPDRQPDGASPTHQPVKERHVGFSPPREEHPPPSLQGAVPKRSTPSPFPSQSRLQSQSRQSRSYGHLPSHPPTPMSSHPPSAAQPPPRPPRGILRSHTHDAALHERADSSSRQRPNLEERGPHGDTSGPDPGDRGDPCQPATAATGPAKVMEIHQQGGGTYGVMSSSPSAARRFTTAPYAADEHRFRLRTRSVDAILDEVDGERCQGEEEDDSLLHSVGRNPPWHMPGRDHQGYVTDFGVIRGATDSSGVRGATDSSGVRGATDSSGARYGNGDSGWRGHPPYRPPLSDRQCGYRSEDGLKDSVKDGSVLRTVTSNSDANRPNHRDSVGGALHDTRPISSERASGYFTDSELKHTFQGQRSAAVKPSFHPSPSPSRQQQDNHHQYPRQPENRYKVLPPLPPNYVPLSERPKLASKPPLSDRGEKEQNVCDRGDKQLFREKCGSEHGSGKEASQPFSTKTADHATNPHSNTRTPSPRCASGGSARPPGGNVRIPGGNATRTPSPRCAPGGSARTPADPYQTPTTGSVQTSGSHALQGDVSTKPWDRFSPKDTGQGEGASSGHYSVSRACLQHDSYSDSRPSPRDSKEPSTCSSSNQDSGYIDHHPKNQGGGGGEGRSGGEWSTTPSSSFSMDRSSSLGPPSTSSSPYMIMGGHTYGDYVPMGGGGGSTALPPSSGSHNRPSPAPWSSTSLTPAGSSTNQTRSGGGPASHYTRNSPSGLATRQQPISTSVPPPPPPLTSTTTGGSSSFDAAQGRSKGAVELAPPERPLPRGTTPESLVQKQVQGWYQQRLLEAAQRLRNSEQYAQPTDSDRYMHTANGDIKPYTYTSSNDNKPFTQPSDTDYKQSVVPSSSSGNKQQRSDGDSKKIGHSADGSNNQHAHSNDGYKRYNYSCNGDNSKQLTSGAGNSYSTRQYAYARDGFNNVSKSLSRQEDTYNKPHTQSSSSHMYQGENYRQYTRAGDGYRQYTQPSESYKQHTQPSESYKQHMQPSERYKQHTQPSESYKQHTQPSDTYYKQQHPQPSDSYYQPHTHANDGYNKQHAAQPQASGAAGYKWYGQFTNNSGSRQGDENGLATKHYGPSTAELNSSFRQQRLAYPENSHSAKQYEQAAKSYVGQCGSSAAGKPYGQVADGYVASTANKQYGRAVDGYNVESNAANKQYGKFTTIPIRYDPVNGSDV
ncbi:hypothetical protein ACOMHN_043186 [Nucella lapillus]